MSSSGVYLFRAAATSTAAVIGGYTDFKTRTVSNVIPLVIFLCGLFPGVRRSEQIFGLCFMVFALLLVHRLTGKRSGGADIKMYLALSFNFGFTVLIPFFMLAYLSALIYRRINRIEKGRPIPMCICLGVSCYITQATVIVFHYIL